MTMKPIQQKAIEFIYIVKQTFIDQPSKFNEFAKIISAVKLEENHSVLISKLKTLFQNDHPDLLYGLNHFLPDNVKYGFQHHGQNDDDDDDDDMEDHHPPPPPPKKLCTGEGKPPSWLPRKSPSELFDKIRDRCIENDDHDFRLLIKFSETVLAYHDKKITYYQVDKIFKNLFKDDPDLFIESNRVVSQSVDKSDEKSELLSKGVKEGVKSELLSKGEEDHKSSESFSKGQKESDNGYCSLYEETMDIKEFYLFEMDLAFSRLGSTIEKLEKNPDRLEECFTVLDYKCIKKLYNDSDDDRDAGFGEQMVEIFKSDSVGRVVGRVVVLERLRQKKMQLEEQKLRLDRIWNEIFEDITKKGRVCRHREFLQRTEKASTNGFKR